MSARLESSQCSICKNTGGKCICGGCNNYFCLKHFNEHRQELSTKFDADIVRIHDELLEEMNKTKTSNASHQQLYDQIDQWERLTIEKVQKAAECARQRLTQHLDQCNDQVTKRFEILRKEIRHRRDTDDFYENDIEQLLHEMNQIQISIKELIQSVENKTIVVTNDQIDWTRFIRIENEQNQIASSLRASSIGISLDAQWQQNGTTVAGGNGVGYGSNQFDTPLGLYVDDDQTVYVADLSNNRIMEWKIGATNGKVAAGGHGPGNGIHQLNRPIAVVVDKESDSLLISDSGNKRIVRWPRRNGVNGKVVLSNINCVGLAMDKNASLYVVDSQNQEVRRYRRGEHRGVVVAGGNGSGDRLDQFSSPQFVFVDQDLSIYVSDLQNHRIMKWEEGAKHGIVVAGGQGSGKSLTQLYVPIGIFVDQLGNVYVGDQGNDRIMCWCKGATKGNIIAGGQRGDQSNQFFNPIGLSLDRYGNLYVVDERNHRVQRFSPR